MAAVSSNFPGVEEDTHYSEIFNDVQTYMQNMIRDNRLPKNETNLSTAYVKAKQTKDSHDVDTFIDHVLNKTPHAPNLGPETMEFLANVMHPHLRNFLIEIGRDPEEGVQWELYNAEVDTEYNFLTPFNNNNFEITRKESENINPNQEIACGEFKMNYGQYKELSDGFKVVIDHPNTTLVHAFQDFLGNPKSIDDAKSFCHGLSPIQTIQTDSIAVVGPVHIMFDHNLKSKPFDPKMDPITMVSIAAPDVSKNGSEIRKYYVEEENKLSQLQSNIRVDKLDEMKMRLKHIWCHVTHCYEKNKIFCASFSALGCGAFRGRGPKAVKNLPKLYAEALKEVLTEFNFQHLKVIFVAIPRFTPNDHENFDAFQKVFENPGELNVTVVITPYHGMVDLILTASNSENYNTYKYGILNPSDVVGTRCGYLGNGFDRVYYALEEILALQTTLLAGHRDICTSLWKHQNSKQIEMVNICSSKHHVSQKKRKIDWQKK